MPQDEAHFLVKWRGVIAAVYRMKSSGHGKTRKVEPEYIAYLTLKDVRSLLAQMEPLAGPADEPLAPPISGPERETWKVQEGPNA